MGRIKASDPDGMVFKPLREREVLDKLAADNNGPLPDKAGSLCTVLNLLASHHINMRKLESRPLRGQCWKYAFFADVECDLEAPQYADALQKLAEACTSFRILGCYPTGPQLDRTDAADQPEEARHV